MDKIPTDMIMSLSPRVPQCLDALLVLVVVATEWCERDCFTSVVHFCDLNPEKLYTEDATLHTKNRAAEHKRIFVNRARASIGQPRASALVTRVCQRSPAAHGPGVRPRRTTLQIVLEPTLSDSGTAAPFESAESQDCRARQRAATACW